MRRLAEPDGGAVWRTSLGIRISALALAGGSAALGASVVAVAAKEHAVFVGIAFVLACFLAPAAVGLLYAFRARIVLAPDSLVVVTTFSQRRFAWATIRRAEPGYAGLTIVLRNGDSFLAGAVQKTNVSTWMGRRTRADELAELITVMASEAG